MNRNSHRSSKPSRRKPSLARGAQSTQSTRSTRGAHASSRQISNQASMGRDDTKRGAHASSRQVSSRLKPTLRNSAGQGRSSRRQKVHTTAGNSNELKQMRVATAGAYRATKRTSHQGLSQGLFTKRRLKIIGLAVLVLALLGVLIFGLGTCVYRSSLTSAMSLDSETRNALTPAEANAPSYTLVAGVANSSNSGGVHAESANSDSDSAGGSGSSGVSSQDGQSQSVGALMLIRIDEAQNQISLLGIPNILLTSLSDGQEHTLREAVSVGGEAELISAVSQTLDVPINHYVSITDQNFISLVDALGGVQVTVNQKVDDPRVGTVVLNAGEQTLNGAQALTFACAWNYQNGRAVRLDNQQQLLTAILAKAQASVESDDLTTLDALSQTFKTDFTYEDLERLAHVYATCQNRYYTPVPGSFITSGDQPRYRISSDAWSITKERFMAGEDPEIRHDTSQVNKANTTIEVLNGSGVDGYAAQVGQLLSQAGYNVTDTGNAPSYVYDETLVVYRYEEDKLAAQAVVQDLGAGRTVFSSSFYSLTTNLQVYVGKDWKPSG